MTGSGLFNRIGITLLAAAFVASVFKVATRVAREADPEQVTIRICHWQLEAGMRDAFDAVAREYTQLHPKVRVEQIAVPGRVYDSYRRTRLAGQNVPDLVEMGGSADDLMARYFLPLTRYVEQPNPYNAGTELESLPWRETFTDGLGSAPGLETLQEYYAIPNSIVTVRVYYNKSLHRQITGHDNPPENFEQFMALCQKSIDYAQQHGMAFVPLAGSRFNANILLDALFRGQTQKLSLRIDEEGNLNPPAKPALAFLDPRVNLDTPAIQSGLKLMREVGVMMPAGFLQLDREDAIFHFAQGRALMIVTGSWDYSSIADQSPFEIGLFPIPLPEPENPQYGRFTLGPISEAGKGLGVNFFVSRDSPNSAVAIDFLQFLTSRRGHELFVKVSKWLPVIVGVEPAEETKGFAPRPEGYTDGFSIAPLMWGSGEMYRLQSNNLHELLTPRGSLEKFLRGMRPQFGAAVVKDAGKIEQGYDENLRRLDSTLTGERHAASARQSDKLSAGWETQNQQEASFYFLRRRIQAASSD